MQGIYCIALHAMHRMQCTACSRQSLSKILFSEKELFFEISIVPEKDVFGKFTVWHARQPGDCQLRIVMDAWGSQVFTTISQTWEMAQGHR